MEKHLARRVAQILTKLAEIHPERTGSNTHFHPLSLLEVVGANPTQVPLKTIAKEEGAARRRH